MLEDELISELEAAVRHLCETEKYGKLVVVSAVSLETVLRLLNLQNVRAHELLGDFKDRIIHLLRCKALTEAAETVRGAPLFEAMTEGPAMPTEPTPTDPHPLATEWCRRNGKRPKHVVRDDGSETWWWGRQWPEDDDAEYKLPGLIWHLIPPVHDTELDTMRALEDALRDCGAACGADEAVAAEGDRCEKIAMEMARACNADIRSDPHLIGRDTALEIAAAIRRGHPDAVRGD